MHVLVNVYTMHMYINVCTVHYISMDACIWHNHISLQYVCEGMHLCVNVRVPLLMYAIMCVRMYAHMCKRM